MKTSPTYVSSKLLPGDVELLQQHSFTRWMSRDLMQAAADFCRNLGLVPAYCECSPDHLTRYLFWRLPQGAMIEVRSGRTKDKFEEFDRANRDRNLRLLSLHINESDVHSAVWVSSGHFETAKFSCRTWHYTGRTAGSVSLLNRDIFGNRTRATRGSCNKGYAGQVNPIGSFLYRADAERASDLLKSAGIDSMVRDANDCPEGYRVLTRQPGFTLWVLRSDQDKAMEVLKSAHPPPLLCQVCGTARATEHVTVIRKRHRETKHFCTGCYAATSIT